MLPGQKYTPDDIGRILWRGKWLLVAPLVLAAAATAGVLRYLPNIYRSETTILVVPQRVPESYVRATVTAKIVDRLQTISQQLMSRSRLEPIIVEFNLYEQQRRSVPMEDVVQTMRADVQIRNLRGDAFVLGFASSDPEVARKVTERLASLFVEENLRDREVLADATNQFLESQLEDARGRLIENEKRLEVFRQRHAGELPTQAQGNLQAMQNLQMQVQSLSDSLARDRDRRLLAERSLAEAQANPLATDLTPATPGTPSSVVNRPASGSAARQLAAAQQALEDLRTRLTPEHPDVVRGERIVKELEIKAAEEELAAANAAANAASNSPIAGPTGASAAVIRRLAGLGEELALVTRDIGIKEVQLARLESQISDYRARLDAAPAHESELTELMRDYDTIRGVYTSLLAKREDSKVAANLERRQIGEQFRVLDPARRPETPVSPNRPLIALIGAAAGLGLGLLLIAAREIRNTTFRAESHVTGALNLPVLATVPRMLNARERRRHVVTQVSASLTGVVVVVAAAAAAAAWRWLK